MANVYKPGLLQIRPQYTPNPETAEVPQNILWFKSNTVTTPSQPNLISIQDEFDADWGNLFADYGSSQAHYTGSVITDWSSASGLQNNSVGTFTPVIGGKSEATPNNAAALISYQVALRWRGGHFRTYLPWVGIGALDSSNKNKLSTTAQSDLADDLNSVITGMSATGILGGQIMVCYKNKNNPSTAETLAFFAFTVQPYLASQRRRLRHVSRA